VAAEIDRLQNVGLARRICAEKTYRLEEFQPLPLNDIVRQLLGQGRFGVPCSKIDTNPVSYGEKVL